MVDASQIRARLAEWIDGRISVSEFEDWFVPETWAIHKSNDAEAEDLTDEIELGLSEYSGGYVSEKELKETMKGLANAICPFEPPQEVYACATEKIVIGKLRREFGSSNSVFAFPISA